nr:hypothetical protein [Stackebrandtia albiflava]
MALTTPPRRYDLLADIPELAEYARPAVRLHPRQGDPGVHDSSVGGPLLWPAAEPWPMCDLEHEDCDDEPFDYVLAERAALKGDWPPVEDGTVAVGASSTRNR